MSAENNANSSTMSRLAQVQLKFQQKQMQEREKKRLEMTSKGKPDSNPETVSLGAATSRTVGNGRVRQMFDERRRGAGIDRSNPLKPISTSNKDIKVPSANSSEATGSSNSNIRRRSSAISSTSFGLESKPTAARAGGDINNLARNVNKMSIRDNRPKTPHRDDRLNNNITMKAKTETSLKPVVVKKTPITGATTPSTNNSSYRSSPLPSPRRPVVSTPSAKSSPPSTKTSLTKIAMAVKPPPRVVAPPPGMATCPICSRNFNEDRLEKHKEVCQKMATKKRKIFDVTKQRVKGTGAEPFVKKQLKTAPAKQLTGKKSDWRLKHEEFIATIRNAKKVQQHLAKGGKLTDLPPAPVSTNPDYITCPHCSRRFNQQAAERHIPKCANMRHNKPKPPGQAVKKRY